MEKRIVLPRAPSRHFSPARRNAGISADFRNELSLSLSLSLLSLSHFCAAASAAVAAKKERSVAPATKQARDTIWPDAT